MTGRAAQKAEAVKLVVLDVDGVMTDGTLTYFTTEFHALHFMTVDERRDQAVAKDPLGWAFPRQKIMVWAEISCSHRTSSRTFWPRPRRCWRSSISGGKRRGREAERSS